MLSSPGSEYNEKSASWEIGGEKSKEGQDAAGGAADRVSSDRELFIRKTFEQSPEEGCALLFRLYYNPLCSYAVRFLYSKDAAADLVSEMFYAFWKKPVV